MSKSELRFMTVVAALMVASACNGCFGCKSPVDQTGSTLHAGCDDKEPLIAPQKLDILFVVDNSGSMKEEQEGVARELTAFVDSLRVSGGVAQDIRVGLITTTVYQHTQNGGMDFFLDCPSHPASGLYCG